MAATMPPMASMRSMYSPSAALDFVGERFDEVGAAERVDGVGDSRFRGRMICGVRRAMVAANSVGSCPGFIEGISVQRLRAAEHRGKGLNRGADDVVIRLLRGQRAAGGLRMKAQRPGARILGLCSAQPWLCAQMRRAARYFGNLLKEIIVGVEEKRKLRHKLVHVEAAAHSHSTYPYHRAA